jgi:hypothetical protein
VSSVTRTSGDGNGGPPADDASRLMRQLGPGARLRVRRAASYGHRLESPLAAAATVAYARRMRRRAPYFAAFIVAMTAVVVVAGIAGDAGWAATALGAAAVAAFGLLAGAWQYRRAAVAIERNIGHAQSASTAGADSALDEIEQRGARDRRWGRVVGSAAFVAVGVFAGLSEGSVLVGAAVTVGGLAFIAVLEAVT